MVMQPSLTYDPEQVNMVRFASFLLPTKEYRTILTNFPGTNCASSFGDKGNFFLKHKLYSGGKLVYEYSSYCLDQDGYLEGNLDDMTSFLGENVDGILITEYHHAKSIPVELYFSHIHRESGAYLAYPASIYMGEVLFPDVHAFELENTLFWPGLSNLKQNEISVVVLNPYHTSFLYQTSLFMPDGSKSQTKVLKIPPYSHRVLKVEELFPKEHKEIEEKDGQSSLCVAAQYKVLCYVLFKNRDTGVITSIDHLHRYCLY